MSIPLKKLLISAVLCSLLALGFAAGPTLINVAQLNYLAYKNPGMFNGQVASGNFAQLIIDYIMKMLVTNGITAATESRVGIAEKLIAAGKELAQGNLNYAATLEKTDVVAKGSMNFPADLDRACRISQEQADTQGAAINTHIETKVLAIASSLEFADGSNAAVKSAAVMKRHNDKYCSIESLELKRCDKLSTMQDADLNVGTLLTAQEGDTMTRQRHDASRDFIKMVTAPIPPEDVPVAFEKSIDGQRFLLERRRYAALISMSEHAYLKMLAARTSGTLEPATP